LLTFWILHHVLHFKDEGNKFMKPVNQPKTNRPDLIRSQSGFSLMEVLVSMAISLIVTSSMIALMGNSLGNTTRIIRMTKLTDDLRTSLQLMSRDVRRANYSASAVNCFANVDCATDGSVTMPGDVWISDSGDCILYLLDRDHDGDATENDAGGFRWFNPDPGSTPGRIEMWVGGSSPECVGTNDSWVSLTDQNDMDITTFTLDDDLSYTEVILDDGFGNQTRQRVRKIRFNIAGQLVSDGTINRQISEVITIRNHLVL
jgi:prepilin-type N-terminal cleavage/methylation domain-containing protein